MCRDVSIIIADIPKNIGRGDIKMNDNTHTLPKNALRDIPSPNADAKEIVGLIKDSGRVTGYKLSDGEG